MPAGVIVKLQPNQDVITGLESACIAVNIRHALIISGVGSVNDAWFSRPGCNGNWVDHRVEGPGLEIAGLTGEVLIAGTGEGKSKLTAWATNADGEVTGGLLIRGINIVCVTFEIILQTWLDFEELGFVVGSGGTADSETIETLLPNSGSLVRGHPP